jgi:hypothetical protein
MNSPLADMARARAQSYFEAVDRNDLFAAYEHWTERVNPQQYGHFVWETIGKWGKGSSGPGSEVRESQEDDRIELVQDRLYEGLPFGLAETLTFRPGGAGKLELVQWTPFPSPSASHRKKVLKELGPAFYKAINDQNANALDDLFPASDAGSGLGKNILSVAAEDGNLLKVHSLELLPQTEQPNHIDLLVQVTYSKAARQEKLKFFLDFQNQLRLHSWKPG